MDGGFLCGILAVQVLASTSFWIEDPCVVFWLYMYWHRYFELLLGIRIINNKKYN